MPAFVDKLCFGQASSFNKKNKHRFNKASSSQVRLTWQIPVNRNPTRASARGHLRLSRSRLSKGKLPEFQNEKKPKTTEYSQQYSNTPPTSAGEKKEV